MRDLIENSEVAGKRITPSVASAMAHGLGPQRDSMDVPHRLLIQLDLKSQNLSGQPQESEPVHLKGIEDATLFRIDGVDL